MVNQPGTKHHGIEAKLKQESKIPEAHRDALATVVLPAARKKTMNGEFTAKSSD